MASLPRPGGNITGLSDLLTDVVAKQLEMLKEAMPLARRIGVLWNPSTPSHQRAVPAVQAAGEKLGLELRMGPVGTAEEFDAAFSTMTRERVGAFLAVASPLTNLQRAPLAELALKHRLPGIFSRKENVEAGGLMSYGADRTDLWRRSAVYIDKILKGAKPADLPVEQASSIWSSLRRSHPGGVGSARDGRRRSSNLSADCSGSSPGLSPLSILST